MPNRFQESPVARSVQNHRLRSFHYAALFAVLVIAGCFGRHERLPTLSCPGTDGEVVITEISAAECELMPDQGAVTQENPAFLRSFRRLTPPELAKIQRPLTRAAAQIVNADRELFFDLWRVADALKMDSGGAAIQLSFAINSAKAGTAYLGIGGNDRTVVFVNGMAVFGTIGWRESHLTQHLVPLELKSGINEIAIVAQESGKWYSIPQNHYGPEWSINLQVFGSREAAWNANCNRRFHPFETPIVTELKGLRADNSVEGHNDVSLYNLAGVKVMDGKIAESGEVSWPVNAKLPDLPFMGVIVVNDTVGEVIVVTGDQGIESVYLDCSKKLNPKTDSAWVRRMHHLFKPEFKDIRNQWWWARRAVVAMAKVQSPPVFSDTNPIYSKCPSARIEFGEYVSAIDGTKQFYRYFRATPIPGMPPTLAVQIPTVLNPVRPYLETPSLADISGAENLASIAEAKGIDILWSGSPNVDCGGNLTRKEVEESVADYRSKFDRNGGERLFYVGNCSSGIAALGCSLSGMNPDGIVLWSPTVHRRNHRWFPGLDVDDCPYPESVLLQEQTNILVERFKQFPIYLYYDTDLEGHGNRVDAGQFMDAYDKAGGHGTRYWLTPPDTNFVWGLRAIASFRKWMEWIALTAKKAAQHEEAKSPIQPNMVNATAKAALLNGFYVDEKDAANPVFSHWLDQWLALMTSYRGERPKITGNPNSTATRISPKELDAQTLAEIRSGDFCRGVAQLSVNAKWPDSMLETTPLWGFRLVKHPSGRSTVEVLTDSAVDGPFPKSDLLVDGCCEAALWGRIEGKWTLLQVWL